MPPAVCPESARRLKWLVRLRRATSKRTRRPTLQSTGRAPASWVTPVISNVGHHGRFVGHSLRSAPIEMHSLFAASFHSVIPIQMHGSPLKASASFHASPGASGALGCSARSQSVGAAEYGSPLLSLRSTAGLAVAKSGILSSSATVPCLRALPNQSINRTCPGKPGHAGYLQR